MVVFSTTYVCRIDDCQYDYIRLDRQHHHIQDRSKNASGVHCLQHDHVRWLLFGLLIDSLCDHHPSVPISLLKVTMKSLIWTGVFILLVVELVVTFILVIPVPRKIRNKIARYIAKFDLGGKIGQASMFLMIALFGALAESIMTVRALQEREHPTGATMTTSVEQERIFHDLDKQRIFRAERNMYLAGFTLTLLFVIARISKLMEESVEMEEEHERLLKLIPSKESVETRGNSIEMKPLLSQKKKE